MLDKLKEGNIFWTEGKTGAQYMRFYISFNNLTPYISSWQHVITDRAKQAVASYTTLKAKQLPMEVKDTVEWQYPWQHIDLGKHSRWQPMQPECPLPRH